MGKRVLLITEEWAGSGHRMAAVALQEALIGKEGVESARLAGGLETASPALRQLSRYVYESILRYARPVWQHVYDQERMWAVALNKPLSWWLSKRLVDALLQAERPDVVVATHAYCLSALAEAKQRVDKPFHLVSIPTDYHINRFWVHPQIDTYFVAHEQMRESLSGTYQVEPAKIRVQGIPVRPAFGKAAQIDKASWKKQLQLSSGMFTVLVCGGEGGYGPMEDVIEELCKDPEPLQIIAITGKNMRLRYHLEGLCQHAEPHHRILIKGYEPKMWQWIGAADAYVTKPGGISCAEALALKTPLILYQPLPGQEKCNAAFMLQQEAAMFANRPEEIRQMVRNWRERHQWESAVIRMEKLSKPEAAHQIAEVLLQL